MKRYAIVCLLSGIIGAAAGSQLLSDYAMLGLSPARAQSPNSLARAERAAPANRSFSSEEQQNIFVYETAHRSVVNISTQSVHYDRFFGLEGTSEGSGSGSILDKQGHILTNYHVVEGAQKIEVTLASGKSFSAEIVGYDKTDDMAVLKVDAPKSELYPIQFGYSSNLKVGQRVYAVGNPFGWEQTMTTGIISGLNRTLPSRTKYRNMKALIQTDAAMNPGNSGGPLLDSNAQMIGMNVAIAMSDARQNSGVGFAIPVNRIKRDVKELIKYGKVTRGDIGIVTVKPVPSGLMVGKLAKGGPAERAGLQPIRVVVHERQQGFYIQRYRTYDVENADIITAIDGEPVRSASEFVDAIESREPGETVTLSIIRGGRRMKVDVTLGES